MVLFDREFLLGAATSAHQTEGNNIHSDFWAMEQVPYSLFREPSGQAVDHYHRFREDIDLLAKAGLNAYRFTIEWARIQPQKDCFDESEIQHYREVLTECWQKKVTPVVTLHHFSSPKWLIEEGGWENPKTAEYFAAYAARIVKDLGDLLGIVCTINEANMGIQIMRIMKERMGQESLQVGVDFSEEVFKKQLTSLSEVFGGLDPRQINHFLTPRSPEGDRIIIEAHEKARGAMKAVCPNLKIGLTLSLHDLQAMPGGERHAQEEFEEEFLHYLPYLEPDDFIGVQNYTRKQIGPDGVLPPPEGAELTQMGYEFYPQALGHVIRSVAAYWGKPILVTENGLATADDNRRMAFIREALEGVYACIQDGIPVKGYFYWSLLDNMEWMLGFKPTFGLIAVDRRIQERFPKKSLSYLGQFRQR
ncbi:MAG: family 1 glycosylhydrolase [Clostridia bacterium]|nr:family 1 glycosylhydrolase [Clostridia bacterium]